MIELVYFSRAGDLGSAYLLLQSRRDEPWQVVLGGELVGVLDKVEGRWQLESWTVLPDGLLEEMGALVDAQHFNHLPAKIRSHWPAMVGEVVVASDSEYLIICRPEIDFLRFVPLFTAYVPHLLKDEWPMVFRLFDAEMSEDRQITAERFVSRT